MTDPTVNQLQEWLKEREDELLADFQTLLRFPSIEDEAAPNAPFGQANRDALDFMLEKSKETGMSAVDIEGYCGYAEFGEGEKMVMSLGHLDVVPVSDDWKHEPFGAEIEDGYVYARGTVDDKGPTIASFFAMRAIQACCPDLGVRMRSVFGCNEESGFECVKRYMETEEPPTLGVAPDSAWPCVHAEKGIANLVIHAPRPQGDVELVAIEGGSRPNIVIDKCTAKVRVSAAARAHVDSKIADKWDENVTVSWDGDILTVNAVGKAAHGSIPYFGDSAAIRALRFLAEISPLPDQADFVELFKIPSTQGEGIGIEGADEVSGALSANLGVIGLDDDSVSFLINVRYPVVWDGEEMKARCEEKMTSLGEGFKIAEFTDSPSLFFPEDHELVKTISAAYEAEMGETKAPGVIGGGTYARAIPNTVSIGTGWAGDGDAHENDERLKIEHLFKMSRIYAHILYKLALVARDSG